MFISFTVDHELAGRISSTTSAREDTKNIYTMEEFIGKDYVMVSQEGFEEYLTYLGFGYFKRKIASNVRPTQSIVPHEDGSYTFHVRAAFFNWEIKFVPGVEFEATKPDGESYKGLITFEGNVLTHKQTDEQNRVSTHVMVYSPEEILVTTTVEGSDLIAKRVYKRVQAT